MALSFSHFLNDMMQSLVPALYPMWKSAYGLSFAQIGLISLVTQVTSSLLQPAVGLFSDHRPQPYSLAVGMGATLIGLLLLASAGSYPILMLAAALVGIGSAVFHPEASRVARLASGGRHGLAQSLFQVGGNIGSSLGPILAAFIVIPRGQSSIAWFSSAALLAMTVLFGVGNWYRREHTGPARPGARQSVERSHLSRRKVAWSVAILLALVFSKSFYTASLNSYYTFYLISRFHVSVETAQIYLFAFLAAVAVGTLVGGPVGDRIGRKRVLVGLDRRRPAVHPGAALRRSVLDRHSDRRYRPDPGLGLFGDHRLRAGAGAGKGRHGRRAVLRLVFRHGRDRGGGARPARRRDEHRYVYQICAFLPLLGLLTVLLPNIGRPQGTRLASPVTGSTADARRRRQPVTARLVAPQPVACICDNASETDPHRICQSGPDCCDQHLGRGGAVHQPIEAWPLVFATGCGLRRR